MPLSNRKGELNIAMSGSARPPANNILQGYQTDRAARLRSELDRGLAEQPAAWRPEPGDELVGTFEGWSEGVTRRDERHRIALIRTAKGDLLAVWTFYKVLAAELELAAPQSGDLVLIRRMPDRTNGEGQPYRAYRVVVDRAEDAADPFGDLPSEVAR
jgi:hypothetical protein